jgi:mRNA interferase RelE/StbE
LVLLPEVGKNGNNKKIQGTDRIFELTVTMKVRLTFEFTKEGILLRNIGEHDFTLKKS